MWTRIRLGSRWRPGEQQAMALRRVNLAPVKSIELRFDPFRGEDNESIRNAWFDLSKRFVHETNGKCKVNATIVNDRCDPVMSVNLGLIVL